ncbi:MAG: ATP diphosphatase [Oceanicoccus sp.]|jgi:ATP diphosphatase
MTAPTVTPIDDLLYLMSRLRDPLDGCPWDKEQDFASIVPHTIEESYELADAIANGDFKQIKEELGDVLFQVVFYAQMGKEQQRFDFKDIAQALVDKLVRRHPHVFPQGSLQSRAGKQNAAITEIKKNWEATKVNERQQKQQFSLLDDVPVALPALSRAAKLQKRASRVGFDWDNSAGVVTHLQSELDELREAELAKDQDHIAEELGDVLFCAVNLARKLKVDPESALRSANRKFEQRFRFIEKSLSASGSTPEEASLEQMDALWQQAKQQGL